MSLGFNIPKDKDLGQWLAIATSGLVAPARERIQMEIEAHYAEAVANHMTQQGISKAYAELAALAELGDAKLAAKKFRERYLAESEAAKLEWLVKWARDWPWLLLNYFLFCAYAAFFYLYRNGDNAVLAFAAEFTCWVVLPTALFFMARSRAANSNRRLFTFTTLSYFALMVIDMLLRQVASVCVPLFVIINFKPIFIFLRASYKSLKWPEISPKDTALS
jgi:hypothetical protein